MSEQALAFTKRIKAQTSQAAMFKSQRESKEFNKLKNQEYSTQIQTIPIEQKGKNYQN